MNVLIADDDPLMIRLLTTALQCEGFATFVANDLMQAVTMINRCRIDAVLLDLSMPGGSGADIIQRLKSSHKTGSIPIVVISGSIDPNASDEILALGADRFFTKPPRLALVVQSLRELLPAAAA